MTGPGGRERRPGPPRWLSAVRDRRAARVNERMRRPQPLLKQRMPSGRGAMEQPNITSHGAGVLTPRFWVMVVLTGIAAGLLGALMMAILFNVQYAAFGYHEGSLQHLPDHATYPGIPDYRFTWSVMTWALLAGPVIGLASAGYIRLIGWVSHHRARGTTALFAPVIAFGILGVIGIWYPQLFGNGLDMARDAFLGVGSFSLLLTLFALKPLVTALCLGSGASGGLFTPTLATGAVLGGALGVAWNLAWPGSPSGAFAMVCAAAMIGAAMQAPLSGLALVLELTHSGFGLMVPMMAATGIATLVAFHVDGYSIYSARLPAFADDSAPAAPADSRT